MNIVNEFVRVSLYIFSHSKYIFFVTWDMWQVKLYMWHLTPDLEKIQQKYFTRLRFKPDIVTWKNPGRSPKKNASFTKQTPLNCQNFQEIGRYALKYAKSQDNTWFYHNSVKFGLHFNRDPKKNYMTVACKVVPFSGLLDTQGMMNIG